MIHMCTVDDAKYPESLKELKEKPKVLYYKGNIEILNQQKSIAVIGTRSLSEAGRRYAYNAGRIIGKKGFTTVNGLALGCDTEALKGALEGGGKCVVILPCGLNEIYPKSNQKLAEQILQQGGCLVSEYVEGTKPERYRFVERDRLQSGVTQGILVIEALEKSGTMHTVEYARKQHRRIACYYHELLAFTSGNSKIENLYKGKVIKKREDLEEYLEEIEKEQKYIQLTFDFSC